MLALRSSVVAAVSRRAVVGARLYTIGRTEGSVAESKGFKCVYSRCSRSPLTCLVLQQEGKGSRRYVLDVANVASVELTCLPDQFVKRHEAEQLAKLKESVRWNPFTHLPPSHTSFRLQRRRLSSRSFTLRRRASRRRTEQRHGVLGSSSDDTLVSSHLFLQFSLMHLL